MSKKRSITGINAPDRPSKKRKTDSNQNNKVSEPFLDKSNCKYEIFQPDMVNARKLTQLDRHLCYWNASFDYPNHATVYFAPSTPDDNDDEYFRFLSDIISMQVILLTDIDIKNTGKLFSAIDFRCKSWELGAFSKAFYGFIDKNDNLCIITDGWDDRQVGNKLFQNTNINFKIMRNLKRIKIDIGFKQVEFRRSFIGIARIPKSKWIKTYSTSFWKYYINYYFEVICVQYQTTDNDLFGTIEFGHRYLPAWSRSTLNFAFCGVPFLKSNYLSISSQFTDQYQYEPDIGTQLFAVTYQKYQRQLIEDMVKKSILHPVTSIVMSMFPEFTHYPTQLSECDDWDFSLLRNSEINNLHENGQFILNPFKVKFLEDAELKKLKQIILTKWPMISAGRNEIVKWHDEDGFNHCTGQYLWSDMSKGDIVRSSTMRIPLLTKQELFECIGV